MTGPTTDDTAPAGPSPRRRFVIAGILLGLGLGGFVDGIVLHQILQWHHMLTDYGDPSFPVTTVPSLEDNTLWDGLFHVSTWLFVAVGLFVLLGALPPGTGRRGAAWSACCSPAGACSTSSKGSSTTTS